MTDQTNLLERAVECERLMDLASDPISKNTLMQFREIWIGLANESANISADDLTKKVAAIEKMQLALSQ